MAQGTNTPIMPMFRTLAPSVVIPPSPKRNACKTIIMVRDMQPANGPKMSPMAPPPRRCAVVADDGVVYEHGGKEECG